MAESVNDPRLGLAGLGLGLLAGFGVGYLSAKKRLELKYDKLAQAEIDEARDYYRAAKSATEAKLKEPLNEVVEYLGYVKPEEQAEAEATSVEVVEGTSPPVVEVNVVVENVFEEARSEFEWDYAIETKARGDKTRPYVIHIDEYGETQYESVVYTWYIIDEILADERDEVVDDVDGLVGVTNLQRFGHGTGNPNVVLVRNDRLNLDMEILKSEGRYNEEVQGFLQHNYDVERMPRRHRPFDDDQ